jgi:hypothetical protein
MPASRDPLARCRQPSKLRNSYSRVPPLEVVDERRLRVWKLRTDERLSPKEISKKLGIPISTVHNDLNDQHTRIIAAYSEYGQLRREKNERELEDFKAQLASYLYDPNVVIRGEETGSDGKTRVVELSKFEAMLKAAPHYLTAINIQNKMWGLYLVPEKKAHAVAPGTLNLETLSVQMVQEIQEIARKNLALPPPSVGFAPSSRLE